jgi:DNA-binding MarR family transcriptional regulator
MHPTRELDDLIHQRVRLGILAVLQEVERADFATLADLLGLTAGNLSRNLTVLEEHGLVTIEKTFEGRRPRTWVQATRTGRAALDQEVKALRSLLDRLEARSATEDSDNRATGGSAVPATS